MRRSRPAWLRWTAGAGAAIACASPAGAQLLGSGGPLGGVTGALPGGLPRPGDIAAELTRPVGDAADRVLADARRLAVRRLVREHPEAIEVDDQGAPVVRGEVLALSPSAAALEAAARAGFTVGPRTILPEVGLNSVTLKPPSGVSAREAVRRLRALDPTGQYDFDHIYQESGAAQSGAQVASAPRPAKRSVRVGMVDGSVALGHPALSGVTLTQRAFGPGGPRVTAHATAVASLLVGPRPVGGSELLVADVYGPTPAGGSALAIAQGLAWLVKSRVGVIDISLVGPPNLVLAAAVRGVVQHGSLLVAAVGNDGPAAPPLYPAAYTGVIAVTAVDSRRRVLPEAGRGPHVAFAAPGAQMAAADPGGGFTTVRGTSFAAPIVASLLAEDLSSPDGTKAAAAVRTLAAGAQDLGTPGRDPVYGFGLVGSERRMDPASVRGRPGR